MDSFFRRLWHLSVSGNYRGRFAVTAYILMVEIHICGNQELLLDRGVFPNMRRIREPGVRNILNKGLLRGEDKGEHDPRHFLDIVPTFAASLYGNAG
jgi:hypothetical protein